MCAVYRKKNFMLHRMPSVITEPTTFVYDPSFGFFPPFFASAAALAFLFFSAAFCSFFFFVAANSSAVLGTGLKKSFKRAVYWNVSITRDQLQQAGIIPHLELMFSIPS